MKVIITAHGTDMSSEVDQRFGRAEEFLLVDTDSGEMTACVVNQDPNISHGAGLQAAQNVANLGAKVVITGNVGPRAFAALEAGRVDVYIGAKGTVAEALEEFKAGKLMIAPGANVEGHWG